MRSGEGQGRHLHGLQLLTCPDETIPAAAILGLAGLTVSAEEAALFLRHPPAGVILFRRNIASPAQVGALTGAVRALLGPSSPVLIDQEGGRVARLRPPQWLAHPPAAAIGALHARTPAAGLRAAWLTGALIGLDCAGCGIDVVCAPVLDVAWTETTEAIGDRAFASDPQAVAALGRALADGLLAAGVQPVGKHAPGHGRATVDSHLALPVVMASDLSADLVPFAANADLPWMLTSHILYPALDPEQPATLSRRVIGTVIRQQIGFGGLLVSDDLAMAALSGTPGQRAAACLAAGCDVALYCPGDAAGNAEVLEICPPLTDAALRRMAHGRARAEAARIPLDRAALAAERTELLA